MQWNQISTLVVVKQSLNSEVNNYWPLQLRLSSTKLFVVFAVLGIPLYGLRIGCRRGPNEPHAWSKQGVLRTFKVRFPTTVFWRQKRLLEEMSALTTSTVTPIAVMSVIVQI
jgi:hypothetical protein